MDIEKFLKETQAINKALVRMNESLIKDISTKLTGLDTRVMILEQKDKTKFDWSIYFRDRVLPQIITLIVLAVLALTFAPK